MPTPGVLVLVLAVAIPVVLYRAYRPAEGYVERWAADHALGLTPENRRMVARYLRSARVLRTWGGVAGALLPSLVEFALTGRVQVLGFGTDGDSAPLGFGTIFVGYLVGALYAEVSLARPPAGARRAARLARRELEDYLPRRVLGAQRALAVAGALGVLAIGLVPYSAAVSNPGLPSLAIVALAVLVSGAGLEALERWLVRRPQPFTSPAVVAADNAIRAQSIHALAGAGLALFLLLCCGVALALQGSEVALLRSVMAVPAVACLVLSLVVFRDAGEGRRSEPLTARATDTASA